MRSLGALLLLGALGCASTGHEIDAQCIAGRLTAEGAALLNENEGAVRWNEDYTEQLGQAQEHDRVLAASCSEAIHAVTKQLGALLGGD